mgnify:FL=1
MEIPQEAKQLISEAKNICIIPNDNPNGESIPVALALFYTLKELNKNVNLIIEEFPEKFRFLLPSLGHISYPKNFVISIPQKTAEISQVYYEKNEEGLKIHLMIDRGNIKKENLLFYFSETKPDLTITLGIKDFKTELAGKLNSYGFLLDSLILNIDSESVPMASPSSILDEVGTKNQNFGRINIIRDYSLSEMALNLVNPDRKLEQPGPYDPSNKEPSKDGLSNGVKKQAANCFLAGLAIYTENFGNSKTTQEIFETAGL